jgi:hypothetical protein
MAGLQDHSAHASGNCLGELTTSLVPRYSSDRIFPGSYIGFMIWDVEYTDEFEFCAWWCALSEAEQESLAASVQMLEERNPNPLLKGKKSLRFFEDIHSKSTICRLTMFKCGANLTMRRIHRIIHRMNSGNNIYLWQQPDWPHWRYDIRQLDGLLGRVRQAQGHLPGRMCDLGLGLRKNMGTPYVLACINRYGVRPHIPPSPYSPIFPHIPHIPHIRPRL